MTFTDASNYVFDVIANADDDSLLTVTLTRFAIFCANLPGAASWLDLFIGTFYAERLRLNLLETWSKVEANEIRHIEAMIKP